MGGALGAMGGKEALGAVGGGISGISSTIGGIAGRGAVKAGNRAYMDALEKLKAAYGDQAVLDAGDYVADYQQIDPEAYQYYAPELEAAQQLEGTSLEDVRVDPVLKEQQMAALAKLAQRADQGLTLSDVAARNQLMSAADQQNRGQQEALLQELSRRGQLGSGQELAARMAAQQSSYANSANELQNLAAQRDQNALRAALESGNLAGNMRTQDVGEQSNLARARDAINQFNLNQRAGVQQRNVNEKNVASSGAADLRNKAYLSNLDLANKQADQRVGGLQSSTNAQNQKAIDVANAQLGIGKAKQAQGAETARYRGGLASGIGQFLGGSLQAFAPSGAASKTQGTPQFQAEDVQAEDVGNQPEYYDSLTNTFKRGTLA